MFVTTYKPIFLMMLVTDFHSQIKSSYLVLLNSRLSWEERSLNPRWLEGNGLLGKTVKRSHHQSIKVSGKVRRGPSDLL